MLANGAASVPALRVAIPAALLLVCRLRDHRAEALHLAGAIDGIDPVLRGR